MVHNEPFTTPTPNQAKKSGFHWGKNVPCIRAQINVDKKGIFTLLSHPNIYRVIKLNNTQNHNPGKILTILLVKKIFKLEFLSHAALIKKPLKKKNTGTPGNEFK